MSENLLGITIELPNTEEGKRSWYEQVVRDAHERISIFAHSHQWGEHISTPLVNKVSVYDLKEQLDHEVKVAFNYDQNIQLPPSFSGVVSDGTLMVVTPELYAENYEAGQEECAYEKLLAHEMAHELHIRILDGEEDLMGPRWFFEGFALYAANQFTETSLKLTDQDIQDIVMSDKSVTYAYYRLLMDELLKYMDLNEAVEHAKRADFSNLIKEMLENL